MGAIDWALLMGVGFAMGFWVGWRNGYGRGYERGGKDMNALVVEYKHEAGIKKED
jgi:hypothetical protein